ncbi:MAG: exopolyphosphatase/guanosine-5'-triphosphate,3'-diphosphate pyrophosphatase, partial [Luteibaculaceae bacterium]
MAETQRIKNNIAIFDLGSNTFNFLIGELGGLAPKILCQDKRAVKFGVLSRSKDPLVIAATLERAENTLTDFVHIAREYECQRIIARGTASFRDYEKSEQFIASIQEKLGFKIDQITGLQEAEHIFYGISSKVAHHIPDRVYLIMDIGGGSVEFIIGQNQEMLYKTSLPLGAILAHETILPSNPYSDKDQDAFRDWITS